MMIEDVKKKLESLDESKESMLMATEWKNPTIAFLFAFFLGGLGVDRFWLGDTGLGVVKSLLVQEQVFGELSIGLQQ